MLSSIKKLGFLLPGIFWTGCSLLAPSNESASLLALPGNAQIVLSWSSYDSASGYLLVRKQGGTVSWSPTDGVTYPSVWADAYNDVVYVGISLAYMDSGLTNGLTYYYQLFSFDSAHHYTNLGSMNAQPVAGGAAPPPTTPPIAPSGPPILMAQYDAAQADGQFPSSGCNLSTWKNLVASGVADGQLTSFPSCGSNSGWLGTGVPTDPYRLAFDGAQNLVAIANGGGFAGASAVTIEMWLRWMGTQTTNLNNRGIYGVAFSRQSDDGYSNFLIGLTGADPNSSAIQYRGFSCCSGQTSTGIPGDSSWAHVVVTTQASTSTMTGGQTIYLNGTSVLSVPYASTYSTDTVKPLVVGAWHDQDPNEFIYFRGDVAFVRLYTGSIGQAQVLSNCAQNVSRFAGGNCQQ